MDANSQHECCDANRADQQALQHSNDARAQAGWHGRGPKKRRTAYVLRDVGKRRLDFDAAPVHAAWQAHLAGGENLQYLLWEILMFEAWQERWAQGAVP
jgi:hypothetical protein